MTNTVYDIDFTRALPDPLKNDDNMLALGRIIAGELQENIRLARLTVIYARIDELEEKILDILARDLHVDWYDDSYPIAAKRQVIKDSVRVHKRLGTKYAVVTALGSVFPHTEVEEWYEYGGKPFCFRILLDMTEAKATADYSQIVKAAQFYKRLTAHLDEVIYQMSATVEISIETTVYTYTPYRTGMYNAGTHPRRDTIGRVKGAGIEARAAGAGYTIGFTPTGTKPGRSTQAALRQHEIRADTDPQAFTHKTGMTGQYAAGENPRRETGGGAVAAHVEMKTDTARHGFTSPRTGTKPERDITFINLNNDVSPDIAAEAFLYAVEMTGKASAGEKPRRNEGGQAGEGGVLPVVTVESFSFRVKRCGTSKTKK